MGEAVTEQDLDLENCVNRKNKEQTVYTMSQILK